MFGIKTKSTKKIEALQKDIKALNEAYRDILNTTINNNLDTENEVRGNNYRTYTKQVQQLYNMYNALTKYGADLMGTVIDTRTALIGGEGISFHADKPETKTFIDKFIKANQLKGYRLVSMIQSGEIEGKNLLLLFPDKEKQTIKVRQFSWLINKYTIEVDKKDNDIITKIKYKDDDGKDKTISPDKAVYVKLGGTEDKVNDTYPKIGKIITQVENYDRALYDLRANNHILSKLTPVWETDNPGEAKNIKSQVENGQWTFGKGYAGPAKFSIVGPPLGALESIKGEMSLNIKLVSSNTGDPVHWLGWTDLMSNRALADELEEFINTSVKKERLIWIEKLHEMIIKAMQLAKNKGIEGAVFDPDGFEIDLPYISLQQLKLLQEVWLPLQQEEIISLAYLRNKIPALDPSVTEKQIKRERKEKAKESPLNIKTDIEDIKKLNEDKNENGIKK